MRRMLSFAFSMSNLMRNEDVLIRRTNEFLDAIGGIESEDGKQGINIVQKFNYGMYLRSQTSLYALEFEY